jgi:hypothetical protein
MRGERGYVALLAVLIVGAASTAVAVALLTIGVDSQRSALVAMRAVQARGLASTCAEEALQEIHDATSYTGTNTLNLGQGSCTYTVTNAGGVNRTITASGTVDTVVRRVALSISVGSTITVTSWQEVQ